MAEASASGDFADELDLLNVHDQDELSHAVSGSNLHLVQLSPGRLEATVSHYSIGDFSLDQGTVNLSVRVRGGLDPKRYGIGLFRPGAQAAYNGNRVDSSRLLYFMPDRELDGYFQERYGWTSLVIPADWIESISGTSRRTDLLQLRTDCRMIRPAREQLAELRLAAASIAHPVMDAPPNHSDWLLTNLRNVLGQALSALDEPSRKETAHTLAHFSTARRAERHMRERIDEQLFIDDVCAALHVSRRYLEYAFTDALGTSPSRYLRLLRLHEVRRRLKRPGTGATVTGEAFRFGFNHLSLFSIQYKRTFGESPSATLGTHTRCRVSSSI